MSSRCIRDVNAAMAYPQTVSRRIPAYIVTGFLGAGKTTLLRQLISGASAQRFAVIVNEFGEMGFDGELIESCCQDVVELKNGCICCRVGDDLVPTLEMLIERETPPDAILIETSGLALPQPVVEAFAFPTLRGRTTVRGVVVLADGPLLAGGTFDTVLAGLRAPPSLAPRRPSALHGGTDGSDDPIAEVFEDQLRAADLVVLTKLDELSAADAARAEQHLAKSLPETAQLTTARHGVVDGTTLLALDAQAEETIASKPARHDLEEGEHEHDDFEGAVIDFGLLPDRAAFEDNVAAAMRRFGLLRAKGFLALAGRERRFILQSTVTSTVSTADRAWRADETRTTRLVFIGLKGLDAAAIRAAILKDAA